ncbi:UNVERIFIED_CONTAM: rRNA biogenesis protein rrp36 [Siphonaria sp. JEL0065]|nr:rRNA biogenesis protein rrp36 [Siphonaria sp. JEL0065]
MKRANANKSNSGPKKVAKKLKPFGNVLMVESESESENESQVPKKSLDNQSNQRKKPSEKPSEKLSTKSNKNKAKNELQLEQEDDDDRVRRRMQMADFADEAEDDDDEESGDPFAGFDDGFDEADLDLNRLHDEEVALDQEPDWEDGVGAVDEEEDDSELDQEVYQEKRKEKLKSLQKELADVPFGQLLEVQQKMGTKEFKRMRRGISIQRDESADPNVIYGSSDDDDDSGPEEGGKKSANAAREKAEIKKRGSKHAPAEQTSKRPVSRFRTVVDLPKKEIHRDPRFNKFSGQFNEGLFKRSYGFLEEYEKEEIDEMRKQIGKTKDVAEKSELEMELQKRVSKKINKEREEKQKHIQRQWKKTEMEAVKQGKKAFYLKKSDKEKLALYEQYKKLGDGKGVDKFLEKRRKKNSASEKRFLPNSRR